jgi:hypothetical protein
VSGIHRQQENIWAMLFVVALFKKDFEHPVTRTLDLLRIATDSSFRSVSKCSAFRNPLGDFFHDGILLLTIDAKIVVRLLVQVGHFRARIGRGEVNLEVLEAVVDEESHYRRQLRFAHHLDVAVSAERRLAHKLKSVPQTCVIAEKDAALFKVRPIDRSFVSFRLAVDVSVVRRHFVELDAELGIQEGDGLAEELSGVRSETMKALVRHEADFIQEAERINEETSCDETTCSDDTEPELIEDFVRHETEATQEIVEGCPSTWDEDSKLEEGFERGFFGGSRRRGE